MGKDFMKTFKEMGKFAIGFAKKFGMSSKGLGRQMGELAADFEHFGNYTPRQLAETAVQMKRLGLEAKDLQGIINKFDDYNQALDAAAKLRRQFGININATKMLSMTAIERAEHMREAFAKSGQDYGSMSDLQQKYIAKTIGQTRESTAAMFGEGNKQKKLNKVKTDAESIAKRTIKTQQILLKLSKNIEKQFSGGGGQGYKGFFDALSKGFQKGVMRTAEMRRAMRNLRQSLRVVDRAGRKIGKSFVKNFPGVKQFLDAFGDFFDPRFVNNNMNRVTNAFDRFFKALGNPKDTRKALFQLRDDIVGIFRDMFSKKKGAGKEMLLGLDTIVTVIGNIKIIMYEKSLEAAAKFIEAFTDVLDNWVKGKPMGKIGGKLGDGMNDRFGESFSKLAEVVQDKLFPAIVRLGPVLFEAAQKLIKTFTNFLWENKEMVFEGIKNMMIFVFKMKWEFLKFAMKDPVLAMVLGFQLFSPMIFGAIGGLFKMGMAKVAGSVAVKFFPNMAMKMFDSAALKKGMPFLHGGVSSALEKATGPANKGMWSKMKGGFSKGMKKFSGEGMKKGLKMMGKGLATGIKAIPVAGWVAGLVIDAGFAFSDAADRYKQTGSLKEAGKGFVGSFLSGLTFGMVSSDSIEDFIFGSSRVAEKAAAKTAARAKENAKQLIEGYDGYFNDVTKKFKELVATLNKETGSTAATLAAAGSDLSDQEKAVLESNMRNQITHASVMKEHANQVKAQRDQLLTGNANLMTVAQEVTEELARDLRWHDAVDDHVTVSAGLFTEAQKKQLKHLELIEDETSSYITLDGDRKKAILEYLEQETVSVGSLEALAVVAEKEGTRIYEERIMASDKKKLAQTIQLIEKSGMDASAQRAQLDLAIRAAKQREMLEFAKSEFDSTYNPERGIQDQYEKLMSAERMSGLSEEAQFRLKMKAAELDRDVAAQVGGLLETQADRDSKKLAEMEAAAETMRRLKEVEGIPEEVKRLEKKLRGLDKDALDKQICRLMDAVSNISDSVVKYTGKFGLDEMKETISGDVVTTLENIKLMTGTVESVITTAGKLGSSSNIDKKISLIGYALDHLHTNVMCRLAKLSSDVINTNAISQLENTIMPAIVDPKKGILTSIPSNIKTKINHAKATINQIDSMIKQLKKTGSLHVAAKLAEGLSDDGKVTFEADNVTINIRFKVDMNAKAMGEEMLTVKNLNGQSGNRLMTSKEINAIP